jgi:hypothetical protein
MSDILTDANNMENGVNPGLSEPVEAPVQAEKTGFNFDLSWLKTETGPGEIEDYINHPFNPIKSKGIAQVLRGLAGFLGMSLKFAIVDILMGILNFVRERRAGNDGPVSGQA